MKYVTVQGDRWDVIAWRELGSTDHVEALIDANRQHISTQVFRAGIELELPSIERKTTVNLPPWRR